MGTHVFQTEALLLVLPTTEYQKRVPVTIGTSLTDRAVDPLGTLDSVNLTTHWKTVCCATQSQRKIQAQHLQKHTVKITKPITLPPFSTTIVHGHTNLKGHGVKLNLIAEPFKDGQLPSSVQCTPIYCNLDPGSNRVTVGLRNILARKLQYHLGQLYVRYSWPIWYPTFRPQKNRSYQKIKKRMNPAYLIN